MRKLAILFIIILIVALGIVGYAAYNDTFKAQLSDALAAAAGAAWLTLSTNWANLAQMIGSTGTYFLAWTLGIVFVAGIFWITVYKLWNAGRIPLVHKATSTSLSMQQDLSPAMPVDVPKKPAQTQQTEEEVKQEA